MKKFSAFLFVAVVVIFFGSTSFAPAEKAKIHWLTINECKELYKKEPRPILIDVYTQWCVWCKEMDKKTYNKSEVVNYINSHYYPVKFDAESLDSIEWNNKKYGFNKAYKTNEFAFYLTAGFVNFPNTVLLSAISSEPASIPGYLKPSELEAPLRFFGEGHYKKESFQDYYKNFNAQW
jgi:thioredoxin-related protein